jgi:manganese/zinc/iron transport system permease protein
MNSFLTDPNVQTVTLGVMLLGAAAGMTGSFAFVRKRALVGDAIAHSVLPGVCLAFLLSGQKHPLYLLIGAAVTGWLSLLFMDFITRHSKIKPDAAIGVVLSLFFGLGILLLTAIQNSGSGNQAGLDKFLFGKAASLSRQDVLIFCILTLLIAGCIGLFFRHFKYVAFDRDFSVALGLPVRSIELLLSILTVLAVAAGIQAVGAVLMAALLITPAAGARFWTHSLRRMVFLSGIFGAIAGIFGAWVSYLAPAMPTGPWIVLLLSAMTLFSAFFAPGGIIARYWLRRENIKKIRAENIVKSFFLLQESGVSDGSPISTEILRQSCHLSYRELTQGLKDLHRKGLIAPSGNGRQWQLTPTGAQESRRIVRLHRLWELYLSHRLGMAADHVHESAEAIEHLLTPEMEKHLLEDLDYPTRDPHESDIPYEPERNRP